MGSHRIKDTSPNLFREDHDPFYIAQEVVYIEQEKVCISFPWRMSMLLMIKCYFHQTTMASLIKIWQWIQKAE